LVKAIEEAEREFDAAKRLSDVRAAATKLKLARQQLQRFDKIRLNSEQSVPVGRRTLHPHYRADPPGAKDGRSP
jgi:hypothetical protein